MSDNVHELPCRVEPAIDLLRMEEDLLAVKRLAFAVNMIACSDDEVYIQRSAADALWEIARAIEHHANVLIERWEAARKKQ
jgi:hypothetical protein